MTELLPLLPDVLKALFATFLTTQPVTPPDAAPTSRPAAAEVFDQVAEAAEPNRFWTAPFVIADLEAKQVHVWGEFTGMVAGEPMEFFVIGEDSGHDYESLMRTYARPSDVHAALVRIGLEPGGSVSADTHRFWPRGDRVDAALLRAGEDGELRRDPVESFTIWKGERMPRMPWVFTGAPEVPSREQEGQTVYAADEFGARSVASTFNLRDTVFDLPLQGSKGAVYGHFVLDPETGLAEGTPMILTLAQANPDGLPVEVDLTLHLTPDGLRLEGWTGDPPADLADLGSRLNAREHEVHYLTVDLADGLTLAQAADRAQKLQLLEEHVPSLRIEPPPSGQAFFQAHAPNPGFRKRETRPSQPIELHLVREGDRLRGTVMELEEVWGDSRTPTVVETRVPLEEPEDLTAYLENPDKQKPVLFVYAPAGETLGAVRAWIAPVLPRFPILFFYPDGD